VDEETVSGHLLLAHLVGYALLIYTSSG
jgi:hypothetical protein